LTSSPSIDILVSSNVERLLYLLSADPSYIRELFTAFSKYKKFEISEKLLKQLKKELKADWCTETQCMQTIRDIYTLTGKFIDPHTAVAVEVAKRYTEPNVPMLVSSTANFGKFPCAMLRAFGEEISTEVSSSELITERIQDVNVGRGEYNLSSQRLIESLNELLQIPHHMQSKINLKLIEVTQRPRIHDEIVVGDPTVVRRRIIEFFQSLNFRG
jgi:threonine synthase